MDVLVRVLSGGFFGLLFVLVAWATQRLSGGKNRRISDLWTGIDQQWSLSKSLALGWTFCLVFALGTVAPWFATHLDRLSEFEVRPGLLAAAGLGALTAAGAKWNASRELAAGKRAALDASGQPVHPSLAAGPTLPEALVSADSLLPRAQAIFFNLIGMLLVLYRAASGVDGALPDVPQDLWALIGGANTLFVGDKLTSPAKASPERPAELPSKLPPD